MINNLFHFINQPNNIDKLKIHHLLKQDGGSFYTNNIFNILLCLIIFTIGFLLISNKFMYKKILAKINKQISDNKYLIDYTIDQIEFKKIIVLPSNINSLQIEIYYDVFNPNIIKLYNYDFIYLGFLIIFISIYILFSKNYSLL